MSRLKSCKKSAIILVELVELAVSVKKLSCISHLNALAFMRNLFPPYRQRGNCGNRGWVGMLRQRYGRNFVHIDRYVLSVFSACIYQGKRIIIINDLARA